jgi:hypothetical protein
MTIGRDGNRKGETISWGSLYPCCIFSEQTAAAGPRVRRTSGNEPGLSRREVAHYTANPIFGIAFMGPPFTLTTFNPSTEFKGSIFRAGLNWRLGGAG